MEKGKTLINEIMRIAAEGDKQILDIMDFVWGDTIYDRLASDIDVMSDDEKEDLLNGIEHGNDPVLYVDKYDFVSWYFDHDTKEFVTNKLIDEDEVSLIGLLQGVGYIPFDLIKNKEDVREKDIGKEYGDIEEPGELYRLEFK